MKDLEFIVALTEHRYLGMVFQPFLIQKKELFYTVERWVKPHDFNSGDYPFKPYEKEIVEIIGKFSDERLMKRFSRAASVTEFYSGLKPGFFEKQVTPFIEECMNKVASLLMLSPVRLFKKEAKYSNLYDEDQIMVPVIFARPEFHFERTEIKTKYRLKLYLDKEEIKLNKRNSKIVANNPCLLLYQNQLIVFEKLNAKRLLPFFEKEFVEVPNSIEDKYYPGFVLKTIRDFDVKASGFSVKEQKAEKTAILSLEKDLAYNPGLVLSFKYGKDQFLASSAKKVAVTIEKENNTYVFHKTIRDFEWEITIEQYLEEIGLVEKNGYYAAKGTDLLEKTDAFYFAVNWLNSNHQKLKEIGIEVFQDKLDKTFFTGRQELEWQTHAKGDWFDVYAIVKFGKFRIPFIKLKKYILNDIREFELPNGEIAVLPEEWFARYKGLLPFAKSKGDKIQFEKHHFTLLVQVVNFNDQRLAEKYRKLVNGEKSTVNVPEKLKAGLRKYQHEGYDWMYGLYKAGLGGCLADDMGLGKTLQALTLLLKLKRKKQEINNLISTEHSNQLSLFATDTRQNTTQAASLIVVPTSLVHNWENEIKKFTPALKCYKYVGIQRKKVIDLEHITGYYDIIITTYGTMRNDSDLLGKTTFFYLVLDESQFVKNSSSKTYKAVLNLKAKYKLVLTGTPIENSLSDLWSQMNFLNPGLLGSLAFFRRWFITPIEKHGNKDQQKKLQLMIRPFVLRRKKDEVASDLPPIMEEIRVCPMEPGQQKIYDTEKSIIRNSILSTIEKVGINKSQFIVLQGLTKLRQLANHPTLLHGNSDEESGKFKEILRMLEDLIAEDHKVLIFSSFVKHLELLQQQFLAAGWKFSKLTGQTHKREKVIKEFQENPENRIFLISLKAGGVGLNLTEADYVFIIDPWWNPAAENQAISRAHRIGQDKHVFVYRFITENSIEEKIQQLKDRKSSLADKFINSNNPFEKITKEEIVDLFK